MSKQPTTHSFDVDSACEYGLEEAIVIQSFQFWINKNVVENNNFNDGRFWTYNTVESLTKFFPYMTSRAIRYAISSLVKNGVLIKGNYNKMAYDQTKWYAFDDEKKWLYTRRNKHESLKNTDLTKTANGFVEIDKTIEQKRQMDSTKTANPFAEIVQPIPVTNAVTNPIKELTTTQPENFENSGTKLNALHREVFEWACTDKYWVRCTNSEEDFLRAYCSPKGGMRKQFEERNNVKQPTGGNNGTHRQPPKKLSPAERVRKAAGIGEFAVGAGGSEFDDLENRG